MSSAKNSKGENQHLFLITSQESYQLLMKGQIQKSLDKIKEAETQLYRQIKKCAQSKMKVEISNMYYIKGLILDRMSDLDKSKLAYLDAYKFNPNNKSICNNLGKIYLQLHHYEDAEKFLLQALQIDDKLLQAYVNLAYLFFETRRIDACIWVCEEALKRNISDYMLQEYLGICHAQLHQNYKLSLTHLGEYMNSCSKNEFQPSFLSLLYSALGNYKLSNYNEAIVYMEKSATLYPQEKEGMLLKAQILYQLDRIEEAEENILELASTEKVLLSIQDLNDQEQNNLNKNDTQLEDEEEEKNKENDKGKIRIEKSPLLDNSLFQKQDSQEKNMKRDSLQLINIYSYLSLQGKSFTFPNRSRDSEINKRECNQIALILDLRIAESQTSLMEFEQLNAYFILGLVYMKAALKKNNDKILLEKAKKLLDKASRIEGSKQNMQILINQGVLQEQMEEGEESFKTLSSTLILHFEKSNEEGYLNNECYQEINKILLHVQELTLLQKFQENLKKLLLEKEIETENVRINKCNYQKTSQKEEQVLHLLDSNIRMPNKAGTEFVNQGINQSSNWSYSSQNQSSHAQSTFGYNINSRKRKMSLDELIDVKNELERPIELSQIQISKIKIEVMKTIIEQLKILNKQNLVKQENRYQQQLLLTTLCEQECSFISNPLQLNHGISSQIGEDLSCKNSNLMSSHLKSCDDLIEEEQPKAQIFCEKIGEEEIGSEGGELNGTPTIQGDTPTIPGCTFEDDKGICKCASPETKRNTFQRNNENSCWQCGGIKNIEEQIEEEEEMEEEEEEEENEEIKQQKLREQEKEKIIMKAKQAYQKEMKENNEKIQQLKLQTNQLKEQEYFVERLKHFSQIKLIQKDVDDLSQKSRILLRQYKPFLFISIEQNQKVPSPTGFRQSHPNTPGTGYPDSSHYETNFSNEQEHKQKEEIKNQTSATSKSKKQDEKSQKKKNKTYESFSERQAYSDDQWKCEEILHNVENFSIFLKDNEEQRDFFYTFKRIIRSVFMSSRSIIDLSYYRKRNITISSLAEMSLGFVPLFQPNMQLLNLTNAQMNIINNEDLVKKCYFVISFANSIEDLFHILDSLSSVLCVFLSHYIRDFILNPSACEFAKHIKESFPVLKNYYEVQLDLSGELFSYFIFYQFFGKLVNNEEVQAKYKVLNLSDRPQFLFNYIKQNVIFTPSKFFPTEQIDQIGESLLPSSKSSKESIKKSFQLKKQHSTEADRSSFSSNIRMSYRSSDEFSSLVQKKQTKQDQPIEAEKCFCSIF